jgi:hypothetical protein
MEKREMDFISHCIKRNPSKLEGRATAGMLIILVVLSLLGWVYLTQASYVETTGRRIQELEAEKARLEQENLGLMADIAEFEAVHRLAARAAELGFTASALDETQFLAVADVPPLGEEMSDGERATSHASAWTRWDAPTARADLGTGIESAHWLDGVAAQFTAWTNGRGGFRQAQDAGGVR